MAQFLQRLRPIETPKSALGFYRRRPDLRPALHPWPCELVYSDDLKDVLVKQWRMLDEGEDDPHYRGFWDTGLVSDQWRKARKVPTPSVRGKSKGYVLKGNCAAYCEAMHDRLTAINIPHECLSFVRCRIKGGRQGHMVLAVHTDVADAIICNIAGVATVGQPNLADHRWHSMSYGAGWWKLKSIVTLEDLVS